MNTYIARYTDNNTGRPINLTVMAADYVTAVDIAKRLPATFNYTFNQVSFR